MKKEGTEVGKEEDKTQSVYPVKDLSSLMQIANFKP